MQVVDYDRSEHGQQRRKEDGRLLHCCCICGMVAAWGKRWSFYCSYKELDDSLPVPKFCSDACRTAGGRNARNVTAEMKRTAKDAEWREPRVVYRDATDREKYDEAAHRQHRSL